MAEVQQVLVGRYRIDSLVGAGGMAKVYQAEDQHLPGRQVAVKELDPSALPPARQAEARGCFEREAQILAALRHPNLATVTDFFEDAGCSYLVMDFIPGQSLGEYLEQRGRLPEAQVAAWAAQLCQVLGFLHRQHPPIVFRDLKPANVIVTPAQQLKLIDFGIARWFEPDKKRDTQILGTPGYAAPEQYGQAQTGPQSDLYSLGVVVHQMLTGYDPAQSPFHLPAPSLAVPGLNARWDDIIARATAMNPEDRFASVADFEAALPPVDLKARANAPTVAMSTAPAPAAQETHPAQEIAIALHPPVPASGRPVTRPLPRRRGRLTLALVAVAGLAALLVLALALRPAGLRSHEAAAARTPTPAAANTGSAAGSGPQVHTLDGVAALISSGTQSGQIKSGGDHLLQQLAGVQTAIGAKDQSAAMDQLHGMEQAIIDGVRQGAMSPAFAQRLLLQLDGSVRPYGLYLAPWNLNAVNQGH